MCFHTFCSHRGEIFCKTQQLLHIDVKRFSEKDKNVFVYCFMMGGVGGRLDKTFVATGDALALWIYLNLSICSLSRTPEHSIFSQRVQ